MKCTASSVGQTLRERFLRTMRFEKPDRLPNFEFGYWDETLPTWHEQGLPREIDTEAKAYAYFGIEDMARLEINQRIDPEEDPVVLEETEEYQIIRRYDRSICQVNKHGSQSIPHFLEYPLKSREDWAWFRERFDPNSPGRFPQGLDRFVEASRKGEVPVEVPIGSLCGVLRNWMGFENYAMATITEREWLAEMMEDLTNLVIATVERACAAGVRPDVGYLWEDITFNSGPIVHPDLFYGEAVPRYKRIVDVLHKHGCGVIYVDSDGNIDRLADGWLDAGINCMFPLEINGGTDPAALREKYGHRVLLMGGVDKMKLAGDRKTIEKELKRLLPVVEDGAFIPHVDHRVPPTVSLENYKFYLDLKREMFGAGKLDPQYR